MTAVLLLAGCFAHGVDRDRVAQLDREVIALQQHVKRLEGQLDTCDRSDHADPIYPEIVQVLRGQRARVSHTGRTTFVTVGADELFGAGVSLRVEAGPLLDLLTTTLKLHPDYRVDAQVFHDDGAPPPDLRRIYPGAWEFTAARAASLVRALIEQWGVDRAAVRAVARGDQEPEATNDTPEGRALNRRVVLRITPPRGA